MKFTLKIFLFFLTLFFINNKNYILKSQEINNDQRQFLNIFIDKELNGSMNNFLNNLYEQKYFPNNF